jgi:hypothetical protein
MCSAYKWGQLRRQKKILQKLHVQHRKMVEDKKKNLRVSFAPPCHDMDQPTSTEVLD